MDRDMARKLIAIVATKKIDGYSKNDFITVLSYKRALMPPDAIDKFLSQCIKNQLLIIKDEKYLPNFSTDGVIVPLDFNVDLDILFSDSSEKPLADRLLETASASGKLTKKEAIINARKLLSGMQFIDFETALITVLSDSNIDIHQFVIEKEESLGHN
ncbi:MAG: DUF2240 family protein [Ferroplasma sp.]